MSVLQGSLLALAVVALLGAATLNATGRYADWEAPAPNAATAELVGFGERVQAWVALQEENGAPADVYQYANWEQLGVADAVGSRLRTEDACYELRADARFVIIQSAESCADDWTEAVQVFGSARDAAEINRRLSDGRLAGWRSIVSADRDAG